jgi:hypothetical protein
VNQLELEKILIKASGLREISLTLLTDYKTVISYDCQDPDQGQDEQGKVMGFLLNASSEHIN